MPITEKSFRLLDFNIYDESIEHDTSSGSDSDQGFKYKRDEKCFKIQMYGINEKGETFCVYIDDYKPFFYVKVGDDWGLNKKGEFFSFSSVLSK